MPIHLTCKYDQKTEKFLRKMQRNDWAVKTFDEAGKTGVEQLAEATPKNTGKTAESWYYKVNSFDKGITVSWHNSNKGSDGKTPVVNLIRYGHATRNGGYVAPNDFVAPIYKKMYNDVIEKLGPEVSKL